MSAVTVHYSPNRMKDHMATSRPSATPRFTRASLSLLYPITLPQFIYSPVNSAANHTLGSLSHVREVFSFRSDPNRTEPIRSDVWRLARHSRADLDPDSAPESPHRSHPTSRRNRQAALPTTYLRNELVCRRTYLVSTILYPLTQLTFPTAEPIQLFARPFSTSVPLVTTLVSSLVLGTFSAT